MQCLFTLLLTLHALGLPSFCTFVVCRQFMQLRQEIKDAQYVTDFKIIVKSQWTGFKMFKKKKCKEIDQSY